MFVKRKNPSTCFHEIILEVHYGQKNDKKTAEKIGAGVGAGIGAADFGIAKGIKAIKNKKNEK